MTVHQPIAQSPEQCVWKLAVQDFLLLDRSGSFEEYAKAELLDGEIWVVNAIHSRHAAVQSELHGQLWAALRESDALRCYLTPSVEIDVNSLPEPDIVVGEPHSEGFLPFEKIRLIVEISDMTLDIDMGRKMQLYASAGIAEYWVVDVRARVIHQMWLPEKGLYGEQRDISFGHPIVSVSTDALTIATARL